MSEADYSVIEGLRHIRYDFENSKCLLDRVMPELLRMRAEHFDNMQWELPEWLK